MRYCYTIIILINEINFLYCSMISTAAILAGGKNIRMDGQKKYLMPFQGQTLLTRMITKLSPLFSDIIIVSNDDPSMFAEYSVSSIVADFYPGKGPLAGIHAALCNANDRPVFVFACDYPMLDASLIQSQCDAFVMKSMDALVPRHPQGFEPLHAIYSQACTEVANQLLTERPNVRILDMLNIVRTQYLDMVYQSAFNNFNTPEDFLNWEQS